MVEELNDCLSNIFLLCEALTIVFIIVDANCCSFLTLPLVLISSLALVFAFLRAFFLLLFDFFYSCDFIDFDVEDFYFLCKGGDNSYILYLPLLTMTLLYAALLS